MLSIKLKYTSRECDIFNQATLCPCASICLRELGDQERKGEKKRKGRLKINWSALPTPPSGPLSGLCARLQIDSDVLIYVLMIKLVCNLCSAMLRWTENEITEAQKHRWAPIHTDCRMKRINTEG